MTISVFRCNSCGLSQCRNDHQSQTLKTLDTEAVEGQRSNHVKDWRNQINWTFQWVSLGKWVLSWSHWAESAQSFKLCQQATIEITRRDHSIIACSRHTYMVLFFAHIPFVVNRAFQRNVSEVVATVVSRFSPLLSGSFALWRSKLSTRLKQSEQKCIAFG